MQQGQIVKFKQPSSDSERDARMLVIEDRGPRALVVDLEFVGNPNWPITPTSVYATADLEFTGATVEAHQ